MAETGITIDKPYHAGARCRVCFAPAACAVKFTQVYEEDSDPRAFLKGTSNHVEVTHLCALCLLKVRQAIAEWVER